MTKRLALLLFIGLAWGQTTIAVFDLENNGLKDSEVKILTDRLQSELVKVGGYTVVERKKIEKVFEEQKFQMSGCVEECLIEVGVLLGAKEIVIGSVGRFGSIYTVSARLVNATTGEMIQSSDFDSDEGMGILLTVGMEEIARELADNTNLVVKPKVKTKTKKNNYPKSAIEMARAAKLAADKAAAEAAAATEAAIEAAAAKAGKEARADAKRKKEEEEARKFAEALVAEDAEIHAAAIAAAEEAKREMAAELGLEIDEDNPKMKTDYSTSKTTTLLKQYYNQKSHNYGLLIGGISTENREAINSNIRIYKNLGMGIIISGNNMTTGHKVTNYLPYISIEPKTYSENWSSSFLLGLTETQIDLQSKGIDFLYNNSLFIAYSLNLRIGLIGMSFLAGVIENLYVTDKIDGTSEISNTSYEFFPGLSFNIYLY